MTPPIGMLSTSAQWVVDVKGSAERAFEVSVLRDDNTEGKESFGWFGPQKLMVASSGGPCGNQISAFVWARHIETAVAYAAHLNRKEGRP